MTDPAPAPLDRPARVLAPIAGGAALALLMWGGWLIAHALAFWLHGGTAAVRVIGPVAGILLLLGAAGFGRWHGRAGAAGAGVGAGLVAGVLGLLLLGSKVVVQAGSTEEMPEAANRVRPDAAVVVLGFLATCAVAGLVGTWIGSRLAPPDGHRPTRARALSLLAVVTTVSMLPLLLLGGAVTGTNSGMAVPDGVTSFGAVSFLFPLSLMSDPSIFLEHAHRLFGTLVGLNAIILALGTLIVAPRARVAAIAGTLGLLVLGAGAMGMGHAGAVSTTVSLVIMGVIGLGALGFTHAMISRGLRAPAAGGLLALVTIQGLFGIARVDEDLAWMAAFHGVFGQLVFATGAMVAAAMTPLATLEGVTIDDKAAHVARRARKLALFAVLATAIQIAFGAVVRHFPGSNHALISHIVFSLVVALLVAALGVFMLGSPRTGPIARTLRSVGAWVLAVVLAQFMLGWVAFWATHMIEAGEAPAGVNGVSATEAIITTAHQTGGALLLAGTALALFWARRGARVAARQGA